MKRIIAALISLIMAFSFVPESIFAYEFEGTSDGIAVNDSLYSTDSGAQKSSDEETWASREAGELSGQDASDALTDSEETSGYDSDHFQEDGEETEAGDGSLPKGSELETEKEKRPEQASDMTAMGDDGVQPVLGTPVITLAKAAEGIKITWTDIDGSDFYRVERRKSDGSFVKIARISGESGTVPDGITTETYVDSKGRLDSVYRVCCTDETGEAQLSEYSKEKAFMKSPAVTIKVKKKSLAVKWKKVQGATSYKIYRKVRGGNWKEIKKVKSSVRSFEDKTVSDGKGYYYKVGAVCGNDCLNSKATEIRYYLKGTSVASVVNNLNGSYSVKFNKAKSATGYQVEFSKKADFSKNWKAQTGKLKLTKKGLSKYGHYYIRARIYKKIGGKKYYSAWSGSKEVCLLADVPYLNQMKQFPTGCESVSAVMAMKYLGANISYSKFIDKYLPKGAKPHGGKGGLRSSNPWQVFMGNPRSGSSWGCYAPVIKKAVTRAGTKVGAKVMYGKSVSELADKYINNKKPVAIWATTRMHAAGRKRALHTPSGVRYWRSPLHCLLLIGYDSNYFYFNDPISGKNKRYSKGLVQKRYSSIGKQAVVFYKK